MIRTIRRDITSINCLSMITQTPVFYQLFHGSDSSQLCVRRTPDLDKAFERQDWNYFWQVEMKWHFEHTANVPKASNIPLSEITEDDKYCDNWGEEDTSGNEVREDNGTEGYVKCKCSVCGKIKHSLYRRYPSDYGDESCEKKWICDDCYGELLDDD